MHIIYFLPCLPLHWDLTDDHTDSQSSHGYGHAYGHMDNNSTHGGGQGTGLGVGYSPTPSSPLPLPLLVTASTAAPGVTRVKLEVRREGKGMEDNMSYFLEPYLSFKDLLISLSIFSLIYQIISSFICRYYPSYMTSLT